MITLTIFTGLAAVVLDQASNELAVDAKLAIKRADLTLDYVSRCTGVPLSRLSDQLNGKTPFTAFWRLWVGEMRDTDFRIEFLEIQARRVDRFFVRADVGKLIVRLDELVTTVRMAKASLPEEPKKEMAS